MAKIWCWLGRHTWGAWFKPEPVEMRIIKISGNVNWYDSWIQRRWCQSCNKLEWRECSPPDLDTTTSKP